MPQRVFIAIPLPSDVKAKLAALQEVFRPLPLDATWVRPAGFHITLKFLGEVGSARIGCITSAMAEATYGCEPFSLVLRGLGVFPNELNPKVLWVGIEDDGQRLMSLQREVESRLAEVGFPSESRPFTPHLTLARLKRVSRRMEFIDHLKMYRRSVVGEIGVHRLELLESQLHPAGARYSTVEAVALRRASDASTVRCDPEATAPYGDGTIEP